MSHPHGSKEYLAFHRCNTCTRNRKHSLKTLWESEIFYGDIKNGSFFLNTVYSVMLTGCNMNLTLPHVCLSVTYRFLTGKH